MGCFFKRNKEILEEEVKQALEKSDFNNPDYIDNQTIIELISKYNDIINYNQNSYKPIKNEFLNPNKAPMSIEEYKLNPFQCNGSKNILDIRISLLKFRFVCLNFVDIFYEKLSPKILITYENKFNTTINFSASKESKDKSYLEFKVVNEILNKDLIIKICETKKLYGWVVFYLYNINDLCCFNTNKVVGIGYLPINYLFIKEWKSNPIKIPIKNTINDILIGYVIVTIDTINSNFCETDISEIKECGENIRDFNYLSFVYLHHSDPDMVRKYFNDFEKSNDTQIYKASLEIFNEINNKILNYKSQHWCEYVCLEKEGIYKYENFIESRTYNLISVLNKIILTEEEKLKTLIKNGFFMNIKLYEIFEIDCDKFNMIYFNIYFIFLFNVLNLCDKYSYFFKSHNTIFKSYFSFSYLFSTFGPIYLKVINLIKKYIPNTIEYILLKNIQIIFLKIINKTILLNYVEDYSVFNTIYKYSDQSKYEENLNDTCINFCKLELENLANYLTQYYFSYHDDFILKDIDVINIIIITNINFTKLCKKFCNSKKYSHKEVYLKYYVGVDPKIFNWMMKSYCINSKINIIFVSFLELIYEIISEMDGVYFFNFQKVFDYKLISINFTSYMKHLSEYNYKIWFFMSNLYLKYSFELKNINSNFSDVLLIKDYSFISKFVMNTILFLLKTDIFDLKSIHFKIRKKNELTTLFQTESGIFISSINHIKIFIILLKTVINLIIQGYIKDKNDESIFDNTYVKFNNTEKETYNKENKINITNKNIQNVLKVNNIKEIKYYEQNNLKLYINFIIIYTLYEKEIISNFMENKEYVKIYYSSILTISEFFINVSKTKLIQNIFNYYKELLERLDDYKSHDISNQAILNNIIGNLIEKIDWLNPQSKIKDKLNKLVIN